MEWNALIAGGRKAKSLQYIVLSNNTNGYYSIWRDKMVTQSLIPEAIDLPNPVGDGIAEREARIASDTQGLVQWVLSEAAQ
jgi:hypothetical protein